ncbi:hypothetical protein Hanom_Chr08g00695321 [Helianthus anomalus]
MGDMPWLKIINNMYIANRRRYLISTRHKKIVINTYQYDCSILTRFIIDHNADKKSWRHFNNLKIE